jgi:hypothetical protein
VGLLVALGLLAATSGTTSVPAVPKAPGPTVGHTLEAAPAPAAAPEAAGGQPDVAFNGESGTLAGIAESANASAATGAARNGARGLLLSTSAAASFARWNTTVVPQGHAYASVQTWVRVLSRGAGESVDLVTVGNTQGSAHFDFFVNGTTQRFQWDLFSNDAADADVAVVYNRWYLVELRVEFAGTEHTAEVRIDGIPQESISSTGTDSKVKMMTVGSAAAKTHVQHYDDIELRVGDAALGWPANTPPQVAVTRPVEGAVYGDDQVVTSDYACTPTDHAIVSCTGANVDGAAIDTDVPGPHQFTVTATDVAGYTTTVTKRYTVVDDDEPVVALTSPADGLVVARGAALVADFACTDPGGAMPPSGGCVGSSASGASLDTTTVGSHPFTVAATDAAGNQASWAGTYTVTPNRPDVAIGTTLRARFGGDDVYSANGAGQTAQATVGRHGAVAVLVRVENDGLAVDTFRLRGVRARPGWTIRYQAGGRDISALVHVGGYVVRDLAPGERRIVRVLVSPRPSATGRQGVVLTAIGGSARDTVKAIVRRRT